MGFLLFENTQLIKSFDSLIFTDKKITPLIQHLTGIKQSDLEGAPKISDIEDELLILKDAVLIAHNAEFERGFLGELFERKGICKNQRSSYHDSMDFLALLNIGRTHLNLESFIIDHQIAQKEMHRGYQDSLDLLKVLSSEFDRLEKMPIKKMILEEKIQKFSPEEFIFKYFLEFSPDHWKQINQQIEFEISDLEKVEEKKCLSANKALTHKKIGEDQNFEGKIIQDFLKDEKKLQKVMPHYQYRNTQWEYAKRVGQAFKNKLIAFIQAPTGTGKTMGYLIPSFFKANQKEPVLVVTGTKELQEQILKKDIPTLNQLMGVDDKIIKVTKLIGSNNHFCELIFRSSQKTSILDYSYEERFSKVYFEMLFFDNAEKKYHDMKTRLDIPFVLKKKFKEFQDWDNKLALDFKKCLGKSCQYKKNCSYIQGIMSASKSSIIIGNHSLMLNWSKSLEMPKHIVIDEAHRFSRQVSESSTLQLSEKDIDYKTQEFSQGDLLVAFSQLLKIKKNDDIVDKKRDQLLDCARKIKEIKDDLTISLSLLFQKRPRYTAEYWNELNYEEIKLADAGLSQRISLLLTSFNDYVKILTSVLMEALIDAETIEDELLQKALVKLENELIGFDHWNELLSLFFNTDESFCRVIAYKKDEGFQLKVIPIDTGKIINQNIYQHAESVVLTSATLAAHESYTESDWSLGHYRIEPEKRFKNVLDLPPVYDYTNRSKVYICSDVPNIFSADYQPFVSDKIFNMVLKLKGNSLLLFSSRKRFDACVEEALTFFAGKLNVFFQGMGKNIVDQFKQTPNSVLIGMESFGEGIDIPGDSLQFVYIDKIPDLPNDIITAKRREFFEQEYGHEFYHYFLSIRARYLHQKLGRLLRSEEDKGVVIITDHRMKKWKKNTLDYFMNLLKPYDVNLCSMDDSIEGGLEFIQTFSGHHFSEVTDFDLHTTR